MIQKVLFGFLVSITIMSMSSAEEDAFFGAYYSIQSKHNDSAIGINESNRNLQLLEKNGLDNQKFLFFPTYEVLKEGAIASSYYIVSKYDSQVFSKYDYQFEKFSSKESYIHIGDTKNPLIFLIKLLGHTTNTKEVRTHIIIKHSLLCPFPFEGTSNQQWKLKILTGADEGYYAIICVNNSKVITSYRITNDTEMLKLSDWENMDNQKWKIELVEDAPIPKLKKSDIGKGEINKDLPKLKEWNGDIPYETTPRIVTEKYIPCIYANDTNADQDKAKQNPWYRLRFSQFWRYTGNKPFEFDGISERTETVEISYMTGMSQMKREKLKEIVDKKIYAEIGAKTYEYFGVNAELDGSWKKQNENLEIYESNSLIERRFNKSKTEKYPPGKKKIAYYYQMIDRYSVIDIDGDPICEPFDIGTPIIREVPCVEILK